MQLCVIRHKKSFRLELANVLACAGACLLVIIAILDCMVNDPATCNCFERSPVFCNVSLFFLGMAYGIGGTAFGIAIRYVGFSLTYAISVGISCVLGTLLPPLVHGTLGTVFQSNGAAFLISGVVMGAIGIAICGAAGRNKEKDLQKLRDKESEFSKQTTTSSFSLAKGLPLCLLAGVLSALYGFSLDQGQPIADVAAQYGAGNYQGNVVYIFSNTGAFITTLLYCLYLHRKEKTFYQYTSGSSKLGINYVMSAITGILWYGQFFFYGLGHVRMGNYKFTSWAIHMIMLVLLSAVAGLLMKEWKNCGVKTMRLLIAALAILVVAILFLTYGNYLGGK